MKKIAFTLELNGSKKTIDELAKVQLELDQIAKAIREAKKAGNENIYSNLLKKQLELKDSAKGLKNELKDQIKEFKSAKFPTGSLEALRAEYARNVKAIKSLSAEERKLAKNQQLIKRTKNLSDEINEVSKSFGSFKNNIGRYEESVTSAIGATEGLLSGSFGNFAAGLGIGGAFGAGIDLLSQGVDAVAELSQEFFKLQGTIQQLTGASGDDLDNFSVNISSLASTFGEDSNEILLAANALTKQLTGDFNESLRLIEAGFLGGVNSNGEFLNILQEYPARFKEAGLSGEQFLQVINKNAKEGIFNDRLPDTFAEAVTAIRELGPAAEEAINGIGISNKELKDTIAKDGIGGAIQLIAQQLDEFKEDSPEVAAILADVFKGIGEDGGVAAIKTLANIEDSLEGVIDTSNIYVQSKQRLKAANDDFNASLADLNKELGVAQQELAPVGIQIKTFFIEFAILAIKQFKALGATFSPIIDEFKRLAVNLGLTEEKAITLRQVFNGLGKIVEVATIPVRVAHKVITGLIGAINEGIEIGRRGLELFGLIETAEEKARRKGEEALERHNEKLKKEQERAYENQAGFVKGMLDNISKFGEDANKETEKATTKTINSLKQKLKDLEKELTQTNIGSKRFNDLTKEIAQTQLQLDRATKQSKKLVKELTQTKFAKTSLAFLRKEVSKYRDELEQAPDTEAARKAIEKIVKLEDEIEESIKAYDKLKAKIERDDFKPAQALPNPTKLFDGESEGQRVDVKDKSAANLKRILNDLEIEKNSRLKAAAEVAKDAEELAEQTQLIELKNEEKIIEAKLAGGKLSAAEEKRLQAELADNRVAQEKAANEKIKRENEKFRKLEKEDWKEFYKNISKLALDTTNQLIDAQAENEKRRLQESTERRIENLEERYERQIELAEGNTERQAELREQLALETERIQREQAEKEKQITIKQTLIKGALAAISVIAQTGNLLSGLLVAAQTAAAIAVIQAQQFAEGGIAGQNPWVNLMMNPLPSGRITTSQNIPTRSNGDNVLATVKRGEVILNERQQMLAKLKYGDDFFKQIKVPGFMQGGVVGGTPVTQSQITPQLVNPNSYVNPQGAALSKEQLKELARNIGEEVANKMADVKVELDKDSVDKISDSTVEGFTKLGRIQKMEKKARI